MRRKTHLSSILGRGDHFYADLRQEQPRKYAHKGIHSQYGGPVSCHAFEVAALCLAASVLLVFLHVESFNKAVVSPRLHAAFPLQSIEPVHCDKNRVMQRELIEHSGGRDADVYGANKDFSAVLEKSRKT